MDFITGASRGLGLATARGFARAGAAAVLADVDEAGVRDAARALVDYGLTASVIACDVTNEDQVAAAVGHAVEKYGRLDMAYNNAGIQVPQSDPADQDAADFDKVSAINLRGIWAAMKHELRHMREQGSGAIVNCSSVGGIVAQDELAAYNATKHGVIGAALPVDGGFTIN
ncbi:SDR family NAD(P)-dependent oxidoreductase [Sphingomonas sp. ac-8]|uniref:SDR family NAD(P)-dependent oxidoreductase n=1 Tax=Sphingomonas sp. ac-8 TaxID=3242977 RepID=UPI003A7FB13F